MDQEGKAVPRRKFAAVFMAAGICFAIFGAILGLLLHIKKIYDLPGFLAIIGACLFMYGVLQTFNTGRKGEEVLFSRKSAKSFFLNYALIFALLVLIIIIIFIEPRFMKFDVLFDILAQSSIRLIIALGICITLLIAGTDLSAGRMVGLAAVISTSMLQNPDYAHRFFPNLPQVPIILPILLAIFACGIFGAINGFLVAKYNMHPFIATLASSVSIYGICSLYFDMPPNNSQPIGGVREDFTNLAQTKLFDKVSILVPIAIAVTILMWIILNKTVFGKNIYAIGGNMEAARVSGVNVFKTLMGIFILAGVLYGFGGVLEAARTAGASNQYGYGYELDAIAACCVGGVSLAGGIGKISGIVTGVLIFTVIQYGLQFINVSPMWQQVIKGIIIVVAVAIDLSKYHKVLWH
ncbi:galactose/methyl galactoside ABC transporter permease MglC [Caproicibacter sp.]|uniref:galactose/methyl galactoside ABC transporter permease MglC n=1 Tax=Caproicibacter sp. TaxID=2814884 RepID=UPI00398A2136